MMHQNEKIITIDVEDWYHSSLDLFNDRTVNHGAKPNPSVVTNTIKSLDLLKETKNRATFFVLATVAEAYPDLIKEILNQGHEVACHGYLHKLVYRMTKFEFEYDLKKSLDILHDAGASKIIGFRAPYWSITERSMWALEIIKKCGFQYDSSIFPIYRKLYGIPWADTKPFQPVEGLWEFPPATVRFGGRNIPIAGGGYLRTIPEQFLFHIIKKVNGRDYRVFYFHPYELDPDDTKVQHKIRSMASIFYWAQQKLGRRNNPEKIIHLLNTFKFTRIDSVLALLNEN